MSSTWKSFRFIFACDAKPCGSMEGQSLVCLGLPPIPELSDGASAVRDIPNRICCDFLVRVCLIFAGVTHLEAKV